ncbi:DUF6381 family protein [Streptomyces sp. NPDC057136]|uniref:DUF6381 family protein n=1 Tax=Streptomyces sp. NPDC057136 TaxID=3346029 RepID=UPI00362535FC
MADEIGNRLHQMREKADQLSKAAEHASDDKESRRLKEKAARLRDQSEQLSSMAAGDVYPSE